MRIYLAGPLFTGGERDWNTALAKMLRGAGHTVILPQEGAAERLQVWNRSDPFPAQELFDDAVRGVRECDVIVAIFDGPDADSGTCFECGLAYATGKPIIGLRGDLRPAGDDGDRPVNLMLGRSCRSFVKGDGLSASPQLIGARVLEKLQALAV